MSGFRRFSSLVSPLAILFATFLTPLTMLGQDVPEASAEAVMAFAKGMEAYAGGQNSEAIPHFLEAHEHDPSFIVALFMGGVAASNAGEVEVRDSVWALAEEHKDRLSPYYRYRLGAALARLAGDPRGAIALGRLAYEEAPKSKAGYNLARHLLDVGEAEEAREILMSLDPDREPMKNWIGYYSERAEAHHLLGEHEEGLAISRLHEERFPEATWGPLFWQARALGALGRTEALQEVFRKAEALQPQGTSNPATVMVTAATELEAHGHEAEGEELMAEAESWFSDQPEDDLSVGLRNWHTYALAQLGRLDQAREVCETMLAEQPENPFLHAARGALAGLQGNADEARSEMEWLEDRAEDTPTNPAFKGTIAAGLGDYEAAARLFRESMEAGWSYSIWWHTDPVLASARESQAFQKVLTVR